MQRSWTIFLSAPHPPTPQKCKFCFIVVSPSLNHGTSSCWFVRFETVALPLLRRAHRILPVRQARRWIFLDFIAGKFCGDFAGLFRTHDIKARTFRRKYRSSFTTHFVARTNLSCKLRSVDVPPLDTQRCSASEGHNPPKNYQDDGKGGVEFKRGSLHDGFGGFDPFGGSGLHLALLLLVLQNTVPRGSHDGFDGFGGFSGCGGFGRHGYPP